MGADGSSDGGTEEQDVSNTHSFDQRHRLYSGFHSLSPIDGQLFLHGQQGNCREALSRRLPIGRSGVQVA